jgi:hypothetical protein
LPEELQSGELLKAITSGEVNCLSGSGELDDLSSDHSKIEQHSAVRPNSQSGAERCVAIAVGSDKPALADVAREVLANP